MFSWLHPLAPSWRLANLAGVHPCTVDLTIIVEAPAVQNSNFCDRLLSSRHSLY